MAIAAGFLIVCHAGWLSIYRLASGHHRWRFGHRCLCALEPHISPPSPAARGRPAAVLLTVAALEAHMIEEYLTGFGPAMSRLFNISWTERSFLMIFAFIGPVLYSLTALGLFRRVPLAGFLMCFVLIGPGVVEFVHFIFPALQPDVQPTVRAPVQAVVGRGQLMQNLPNFWVHVTGRYYFPGMYTAILPMIPGV